MSIRKSKLEKCLDNFEATKVYKKEVVRNITVGNGYFSSWRMKDLNKEQSSLAKMLSGDKNIIENELYEPLERTSSRNKKVARRMKWMTMMNRKDGEELEEHYNALDEVDKLLDKTFYDVSWHYNDFLNVGIPGVELYKNDVKGFENYVNENMDPVLNKFDEMIDQSKNIRKGYKKTGRVNLDALDEVIEQNIEVSQIYKTLAQQIRIEYETRKDKAEKVREKIDSAFEETAENIRKEYNKGELQKAIQGTYQLESNYPSIGNYIVKKAKKLFSKNK